MDSSSPQDQKGSSGQNRGSRSRNRKRNRNRQPGGSRGAKGKSQSRKSRPKQESKPGFVGKVLGFLGIGGKSKAKAKPGAKAGAAKKSGRKREKRQPKPVEVNSGRLYVGNLSYDAADEDLKKLFESAGAVLSAEIVTNPHTSKSKGFGFVEMGSVEEAKKAVEKLGDTDFMGRELLVTGARSDGKKTGDAEKKKDSPRERRDRDRGDRPRKRRNERSGSDRSGGEGKKTTDFKPKELVKVTGARLQLENLNSDVTEDFLREAFDGFGTIAALELAGQSARIEMSSVEEAQRVVEVLDGKMFMAQRLKISEDKSETPIAVAEEKTEEPPAPAPADEAPESPAEAEAKPEPEAEEAPAEPAQASPEVAAEPVQEEPKPDLEPKTEVPPAAPESDPASTDPESTPNRD